MTPLLKFLVAYKRFSDAYAAFADVFAETDEIARVRAAYRTMEDAYLSACALATEEALTEAQEKWVAASPESSISMWQVATVRECREALRAEAGLGEDDDQGN
jgi:hypothetical protein